MPYSLKSLDFLEGVEQFRLEDNREAEAEKSEENDAISVETDAGMSLMLGNLFRGETQLVNFHYSEWKMRVSEDSDMCTTCNCPVDFTDRAALLEHYQSNFHRCDSKFLENSNLLFPEPIPFENRETSQYTLKKISKELTTPIMVSSYH